jgi:tRNA threonylcarbamoyladenosine biosynthesis protein TsaE
VSDIAKDRVVSETVTASEEETMAAAAALATQLSAGDVLLLQGELGAGKTAFVRGVARGLGARPDDVSSPTFTLIQVYDSGRLVLYHVDLYRLESGEVDDLGLEELVESGGIVAIEWPDRWHRRPADAMTVSLANEGEDRRRLRISYSTR